MYDGGQWRQAAGGRTHPVMNPATGEPFTEIAWGGREDARRTIAAANHAFANWSSTSLWERTRFCNRIAEVLEQNTDLLAGMLSQELGKPRYGEAIDEG